MWLICKRLFSASTHVGTDFRNSLSLAILPLARGCEECNGVASPTHEPPGQDHEQNRRGAHVHARNHAQSLHCMIISCRIEMDGSGDDIGCKEAAASPSLFLCRFMSGRLPNARSRPRPRGPCQIRAALYMLHAASVLHQMAWYSDGGAHVEILIGKLLDALARPPNFMAHTIFYH